MAYAYPTEINMTENPSGLFAWLNDVTNYWFSNALLITIWMIVLFGYLAVNKDDFSGGFAVSSYVVFVLSLLGWIAGLVSGLAFAVAIGVSLVSTAWLLGQKRN